MSENHSTFSLTKTKKCGNISDDVSEWPAVNWLISTPH